MMSDDEDIKKPRKGFNETAEDGGGRVPYGHHEGRYIGPHEQIDQKPQVNDHLLSRGAVAQDFERAKTEKQETKIPEMDPEFKAKVLAQLKKNRKRDEQRRQRERSRGEGFERER